MRTYEELALHSSRAIGYNDAIDSLRTILTVMAQDAETAFQLQRATDSNYQDPRTDYLLGKKEAIWRVLVELPEA